LGGKRGGDKVRSLSQKNEPTVIEFFVEKKLFVKQIACGEAHTHILSREGFVYSMGVNHYGVLGLSVSEMQLNSVTEP
jgi:alpha-tubulin suppressor-like RCC1 family protein